MHDKHWTDDELVSKLFSVGPDDEHLKSCPDCVRRWESIRRKNEMLRAHNTEIAESQLMAQRDAIYARLEGRSRKPIPILIPSIVTVALLMLAVLVIFRPNVSERPVQDVVAEDIVLEEVFQTSFSPELTAMEPVQALFQEIQ